MIWWCLKRFFFRGSLDSNNKSFGARAEIRFQLAPLGWWDFSSLLTIHTHTHTRSTQHNVCNGIAALVCLVVVIQFFTARQTRRARFSKKGIFLCMKTSHGRAGFSSFFSSLLLCCDYLPLTLLIYANKRVSLTHSLLLARQRRRRRSKLDKLW